MVDVARRTRPLLLRSRVDDDRHGTVVDQRDLHVRAKHAGGNRATETACEAAREIDERGLRYLWRRRAGPRGAIAFARGCIERELADCEDLARDIHHRPVHYAGIVTEDAQADDLLRQPFAIVFGVIWRDRREHEQTTTDRSRDVSVDRNGGLAHALDDR